MPVNLPTINTKDELFAELRRIDISVPGRTDGRTTDHTETWVLARLLSTLGMEDRLNFPLSVIHRDRPDSALKSGATSCGIEVTEAISQQYAAYCALAEREFPDVFLEPAHFRWGAPSMTTEEMRALLRQSQLSSDGWAGDRAEEEWALFVEGSFETKLTKLAHPDFQKFEGNWLAIYDNLPLPNIDLSKAVAFLRIRLKDRWAQVPSFDTIYIEHGPVVVRVTAMEAEHLVLHDLWD
jgi:hypothetical protein